MQATNSLLTRLWRALTSINNKKDSGLSGSQFLLGYKSQLQKKYQLEIPFIPIRPVLGSLQNSYDLVEMATWSYEFRHAVSVIARDVFQDADGKITSWQISSTHGDKKTHADVLTIGQNLAQRTYGREYILGASRLQKCVREMLFYGDSFMELGIEKNNGSYNIVKTLNLPPLSIFIDTDEKDDIKSFIQRENSYPSPNDIDIHPLKVLRFTYEKGEVYGMPFGFQSLQPWRQLKKASDNLEQAAQDSGYPLTLHHMPERASEDNIERYRERHEDMLETGLVTNLYLMPGITVERLAAGAGVLEPLITYWLKKRYECIPPGVPLWFYPGLGLESTSGKDIANQPALNYARLIAFIRGVLGEQIHWAISIEIILEKGFDFYQSQGQFDITWADWLINVNADTTPKKSL